MIRLDLINAIVSLSEKDLFERVIHSTTEERVHLSRIYLRKYPSGDRSDMVRGGFIIDSLSSIVKEIKKNSSPEDIYKGTVKLNNNLRDNLTSEVLANYIDLSVVKEFYKDIGRYISSIGELKAGNVVEVSYPSERGWDIGYYNDRQRNIPLGSIGTIKYIDGQDRACVDFTDKHIQWDYSSFRYSCCNSRSAVYQISELAPAKNYLYFKYLLEKEIGLTRELFGKDRTSDNHEE